jgi:hypothetical protein
MGTRAKQADEKRLSSYYSVRDYDLFRSVNRVEVMERPSAMSVLCHTEFKEDAVC